MKNKKFEAFDINKGQIDFRKYQEKGYMIQEMMPVEIYHKADGAIGDKSSFYIVMNSDFYKSIVYGQISLEMLNQKLNRIGYEMIRVDSDGN